MDIESTDQTSSTASWPMDWRPFQENVAWRVALGKVIEARDEQRLSELCEVWMGLEIHLRLDTGRKLFCDVPQGQAGWVDMGYPGALPSMDPKAQALATRLGIALGAQIGARMGFERKRYAYPDLSKGYQTTQKARCVWTGGRIECIDGFVMPLERAQIEEDAARVRRGVDGFEMDFERAGAPLLEVVGACIQMTPEQAVACSKTLWRESIHCAASLGLIEEGWFKTDINISIKPKGAAGLGERVEVKGVGSFEFCKVAAVDRMWALAGELLDSAPRPARTMGFDEVKMVCIPMREKGQDHAYKFLPDGDLATREACLLETHCSGWLQTVEKLCRIDQALADELGEDPRKTRVLSMVSSAFWEDLDRKPSGFAAQALRAFFEKMDPSAWRADPASAAKALQWLVGAVDAQGIGRALRSLQGRAVAIWFSTRRRRLALRPTGIRRWHARLCQSEWRRRRAGWHPASGALLS